MSREPPLLEQVHASVDTGIGHLLAVIQALAFWATVGFPLGYLSGYLATVVHPGLSLPSTPVIGALLGANVIVVVVGHRHDPGTDAQASSAAKSRGISQRAD